MSPLKQFSGWRPLRKGERLKADDVFVCYEPDLFGGAKYKTTPQTGDPIGQYAGQLADEWTDARTKYWMPYRREGSSIPRRLFMHQKFSEPLPLP